MNSDQFYTKEEQKARRKARRAAMTTDEKLSELFLALAQIICFLCAAVGSYQIPESIFNYYGVDSAIPGAIGFILFLFCCIYFSCADHESKKELDSAKYKLYALQEELERKAAEDARREEMILPILRAYRMASEEDRAAFRAIVDKYRAQ